MSEERPGARLWAGALGVATLASLGPAGVGGILVHARPGPVLDRFMAELKRLMPDQPFRKVPPQISDDRLVGGLDLAATLAAGRPVAERGLIASADGGWLVLPMAERAGGLTASRIGAMLDHGEIIVERDGIAARHAVCAGLIAIDESADEEETVPAALSERLAFKIDLDQISPREAESFAGTGLDEINAARALWPSVTIDDAFLAALVETGLALGVDSMRASRFAVETARRLAALAGRDRVDEADARLAASLVFAHRATRVPQANEAEQEPPPPPPPDSEASSNEAETENQQDGPLEERVLDAVKAAIPAGLLAQIAAGLPRRSSTSVASRGGGMNKSKDRGRPAGVERGDPRTGARLSLIATLRTAAPWQRIRARADQPGRIEVRRDDLRTKRFEKAERTTTVFLVDASGSSALNRLGEAKGAVELLLADCYIRRDEVAMIAFGGRGVDLALAPTRSLARAKRQLAGLPGGGGTPLAGAIEAGLMLALSIRRKGMKPALVLLTDGAANIARDGTQGRAKAEADANEIAKAVRALNIPTVVIDTAPRPQDRAARIASALGARYVPLPVADARAMSRAIKG